MLSAVSSMLKHAMRSQKRSYYQHNWSKYRQFTPAMVTIFACNG